MIIRKRCRPQMCLQSGEVERRHQSWAIAGWNIKIAGINQPLSELLRLLTRRSRRRGEVEVLEIISRPNFLSSWFFLLLIFSPPNFFSSSSPPQFRVRVCRYHRYHSPSSISASADRSNFCLNDCQVETRSKFAGSHQPETEYSSWTGSNLQTNLD